MSTETIKSKVNYIEATAKRKTATARVRLTPASKNTYETNSKSLEAYFKTSELMNTVKLPMSKVEKIENFEGKYAITAVISGGGTSAQAVAMATGIARALYKIDPKLKKELRDTGLLTIDSRNKERRKFGLKKARKAPQWSKR
jgi:small subunit ribosomal protein S9